MAAHRYWRLYITATQGSVETDLTELILRTAVGGASVASGGTASADTTYSGTYVAANAFDGADGTSWASTATALPHWLQYDFGAGNDKDIVEWGIKAIFTAGYSNYTPKDFALQYSDNGTDWTTFDARTGVVGWSAGEVRTYQPEAPGTGGDNTFDVAYLGQPFADLNPGSGTSDTSLDIVYLAEPIGTTGTGVTSTDSSAATSQAQASAASAGVQAGSTASTSQAQTAAAVTLAQDPNSAATSQAQSSAANAGVSLLTDGTSAQAQSAAAAAGVGIAATVTASQAQGASAQGRVANSWALLDRVYAPDVNYAEPAAPTVLAAHDVVAGSQIVVAVYTNHGFSAPLGVTDSVGNAYQLAAEQWHSFSGPIVSLYVALNVPAATGNVIEVEWGRTPGPLGVTTYYIQSPGVAVVETSAGQVVSGSTSISAPSVSTAGAGFMVAVQQSSIGDGYPANLTPSFTAERDEGWYAIFGHRIITTALSGTVVQYTGTSSADRALALVALAEPSGAVGLTRQAQSSSAAAEIVLAEVTSSATSSQAQHAAGQLAKSADTTASTAQGQHTAASIGSAFVVQATSSQAQTGSALAAIFQPAEAGTSQAQASSAEATVTSDLAATSSQAQGSAAEAGVSLDAAIEAAQAQQAAGLLEGEVGSSAATSGAQHSAGLLANAYVADVATSQAQQADAQATVTSTGQATTAQAQGATAESVVSIDASAATDQRQRVRAQVRAEAINTVEGGQAQRVSGVLGLSSDAPTATYQGQTSSLLAGVAADTQVQTGQAEHIGDGNLLVVSVDALVATAQDRQHAAGALIVYQPQQGTLSLGDKRVHVGLAGTVQPRIVLDAAIRVRPALTGRVDLRPDL